MFYHFFCEVVYLFLYNCASHPVVALCDQGGGGGGGGLNTVNFNEKKIDFASLSWMKSPF